MCVLIITQSEINSDLKEFDYPKSVNLGLLARQRGVITNQARFTINRTSYSGQLSQFHIQLRNKNLSKKAPRFLRGGGGVDEVVSNS